MKPSARFFVEACDALLLVIFASLSHGVTVNSNPFCIVADGNTTLDLNPIEPAWYNATVAGGGLADVALHFGWCGSINSTVCNVTNWAMTMESSGSCVTGFEVLLGPGTYANNAISFQMWGGTDGFIGYVTVACNPHGATGSATLTGLVVNHPIYNYYFTFSSVHACAV